MTGDLTFNGTGRNVQLIATNIENSTFLIGTDPINLCLSFYSTVGNTRCTIIANEFRYYSW